MKAWVKVILYGVAIFVAGIIAGFFISPYYLNRVKEIGQAASFIQYVGFGGFALAMWKMLSDWYRENVLEYDGLFVRQQHYSHAGKDTYRPAYYLRIIRKKGRGRAENCDGFVTITGTEINDNTVWEGDVAYAHISIQRNLKLFEIAEYSDINKRDLVFRSNPMDSKDKIAENRIPYTAEDDKRIVSVRIGSSNASVPSNPFIKTIGEIIQTAQKE